MNKVHVFHSIKGGVGCSSNAVGFSCWLHSEFGEPVTLIDLSSDLSLILSPNKGVEIISHEGKGIASLTDLVSVTEGYVVIDAGSKELNFREDWVNHLCIDNHYLSLSRAAKMNSSRSYDDVVVLVDKEAALTVEDCVKVTRLPLFFSVDREISAGRSIDAGLFPTKTQISNYQPAMVSTTKKGK